MGLRDAGTTSSSSAASADDPKTAPFGLGDLRTGEFDLGLELSPFVPAVADPVGRAIGAIGREIGPRLAGGGGGADAVDPGASGSACTLRLPDPGAKEDGPAPGPAPGVVGDPEGTIGVLGFEGGPIGDGTPEGGPVGTR